MSDFTHLAQKLIAERARLNQTSTHRPQPQPQSPTSMAPPPPYTQTISSEETPDSDDSDCDSEYDNTPPEKTDPQLQLQPQLPIKLTLNATTSIQGTNNLIPTSASPLADAVRFSQLVMVSVNQINNALYKQQQQQSGGLASGSSIELTINCGVTVVGDRNVVGFVGVRPKSAASGDAAADGGDVGLSMGGSEGVENDGDGAAAAVGEAVVGAKRKAEEQIVDSASEPPMKRVAKEESTTVA